MNASKELDDAVREGDLEAALAAAKARVRLAPATTEARIALFQVYLVMGDWEKAKTQLAVARDLGSADLAVLAEPLIDAEIGRGKLFRDGGTNVSKMPDSEPWLHALIEANDHLIKGELDQLNECRERAFEGATPASGKIDDEPFEIIGDGDERFGPVLEVILGGRYTWVPFSSLITLALEPPTQLRDLVWKQGLLQFKSGESLPAHIPCRYPGTTAEEVDAGLKLCRGTEWRESEGIQTGIGQRILMTESKDYNILDVKMITFD